VIANQSGHPLAIDEHAYPFAVNVIPSVGGLSAGRNDAIRALPKDVQVVGFPNDDSTYPADSLAAIAAAFAATKWPDAICCSLVEQGVVRFALPPDGTLLDRRTVWRAIEPAVFVRRASVVSAGGFRTDIGTGADSPWQSGEGTDLLLRLLAEGGRVVSLAGVRVNGPGERRALTVRKWVAKQHRYARGTGYVYRIHAYPALSRVRMLAGPLLRVHEHDSSILLSLRIAVVRSFGRFEGLVGRRLVGGDKAAPTE
jgi:hypothetical protein